MADCFRFPFHLFSWIRSSWAVHGLGISTWANKTKKASRKKPTCYKHRAIYPRVLTSPLKDFKITQGLFSEIQWACEQSPYVQDNDNGQSACFLTFRTTRTSTAEAQTEHKDSVIIKSTCHKQSIHSTTCTLNVELVNNKAYISNRNYSHTKKAWPHNEIFLLNSWIPV